MTRRRGTGEYSDFNGRRAIGGAHTYRGPFAIEAATEARAHAANVHAKEVVEERKRREQIARYEAMKAELERARRAASGG